MDKWAEWIRVLLKHANFKKQSLNGVKISVKFGEHYFLADEAGFFFFDDRSFDFSVCSSSASSMLCVA
jgi:hypothetical protein